MKPAQVQMDEVKRGTPGRSQRTLMGVGRTGQGGRVVKEHQKVLAQPHRAAQYSEVAGKQGGSNGCRGLWVGPQPLPPCKEAIDQLQGEGR